MGLTIEEISKKISGKKVKAIYTLSTENYHNEATRIEFKDGTSIDIEADWIYETHFNEKGN